jgi:hypothetical protein
MVGSKVQTCYKNLRQLVRRRNKVCNHYKLVNRHYTCTVTFRGFRVTIITTGKQ